MSKEHSIPSHVLDDICTRFIINIPTHEREDLVRLCFQIELAHWFYMDFICIEDKSLDICSLKQFVKHIFQHIPWLRYNLSKVDTIIKSWRTYKQSVPTYGSIILDVDMLHVLLVQGYYAKNSWMFPKGKVNENERPHVCAAREVFEEVGYDISKSIDTLEYLESTFNDQLVRLYIVSGVNRDSEFHTKTRNEIKDIQWFPLADLPASRNQITPNARNTFYMVVPFIKPLRRWIWNHKEKLQMRACRQRARHQSSGNIADIPEIKGKGNKDKNKKQQNGQQFLQHELRELIGVNNSRSGNASPQKPVTNLQRSYSVGASSHSNSVTRKKEKNNSGNKVAETESGFNFTAKSWENFRLDPDALLAGL